LRSGPAALGVALTLLAEEAGLQGCRHAAGPLPRCPGRGRAEWGNGFALLILAGTAPTRGRRDRALEAITEAAARLDAGHMALFAAAARRARGELLGGEAGQALVVEADAWMAAQSIRRPDRMARTLAPWAWRPADPRTDRRRART
jgi:hypothetical protein